MQVRLVAVGAHLLGHVGVGAFEDHLTLRLARALRWLVHGLLVHRPSMTPTW